MRSPWRSYDPSVDPDALFVATVRWLESLLASGSVNHHDWLLASGRLRLLLLEGSPLVDKANRSRRFDLRYDVNRTPDPPVAFKTWAAPDGLAPSIIPPGPKANVVSLKLGAFLHERVMHYEGLDISVGDIIKHTANVAGGVHSSEPRTPAERSLQEVAELIAFEGLPIGVRCLRGVTAVVVEALLPLVEAVERGD